ncbi:MAG: glycosyltransferase family 4 protein [Verrucomicrobiales bacterium]
MKILVHDYAGHPFQVQLSRVLAARGHDVAHVYGAGLQTPRGELEGKGGDAATLRLVAVPMGAGYVRYKYNFLKRRGLEVEYGRRVAGLIQAERPEVVVSSNTPTEAQQRIWRACRGQGAGFYYWVQDFYSVAVDKLLRKRLPVVGALAGAYYRWLEGAQLRGADGVVSITEDFVPVMQREFGVARERITTIPNWAPLESVPVRTKRNAWSEAHGLGGKFVYLYTGTLGLKHNPSLLLELARRHRHDDSIRVVVVSEGLGAGWLREQAAADRLTNLVQLPYQDFSVMPDVLASGDVLIGVLEEEAGIFSVPSKILTYLCAERPILLAAPSMNMATRLVARERVGMTCAPADVAAFLHAADHLRTQTGLGAVMGRRGRHYAESHFQIEAIADRFETVLGLRSGVETDANGGSETTPRLPMATATGTRALVA